ncbi:hypothetical protein [Sabulicella rubraurantiaca]|uniref:hypothetical protein n=1 Tax=Sabulicella rubraurantiaca TaxID=2811429 RepID=UPI001A95FE07|nr:hypothetical protein [Sabulicella rubraurantiaca]
MAAAAFDLSLDPLQGPFSLVLESTQSGIEVNPSVTVEGTLRFPDQAVPAELRLVLRGLLTGFPLRAEALWRGNLVARREPRDSVIEEAIPAFAAADLDRAIVAAEGALPAEPSALEAARRKELAARLRGHMHQPAALDDATLGRLLGALGAAGDEEARGTVRLRFSAPAGGPPVPVILPVTIAVMARESLTSLSQFLAEARALRDHLTRDAEALPPPAPLRRRVQVLPLLIMPAAAFADWPGDDAASRRAAAEEFFQRESIGLAVAGP